MKSSIYFLVAAIVILSQAVQAADAKYDCFVSSTKDGIVNSPLPLVQNDKDFSTFDRNLQEVELEISIQKYGNKVSFHIADRVSDKTIRLTNEEMKSGADGKLMAQENFKHNGAKYSVTCIKN